MEVSSTASGALPAPSASAFKVVILSACASNLVPCVRSVLENEPGLAPSHIVVVDDGARQGAEAELPEVCWVAGSKQFNFARNANLGIRTAATDVILLNDDAQLWTRGGFTRLMETTRKNDHMAICSAGVRGIVCNPRQRTVAPGETREEPHMLAFICVAIPRRTFEQLGPLDERFTGYGFEDNDYCARALQAGLSLAILGDCVVDHSGQLPSSFRSRPDYSKLHEQNLRIYLHKWGTIP